MAGNNDMRSTINIEIGNSEFQLVKQLYYFKSAITEGNCFTAEIKRRIALGKQAFRKRKML